MDKELKRELNIIQWMLIIMMILIVIIGEVIRKDIKRNREVNGEVSIQLPLTPYPSQPSKP